MKASRRYQAHPVREDWIRESERERRMAWIRMAGEVVAMGLLFALFLFALPLIFGPMAW